MPLVASQNRLTESAVDEADGVGGLAAKRRLRFAATGGLIALLCATVVVLLSVDEPTKSQDELEEVPGLYQLPPLPPVESASMKTMYAQQAVHAARSIVSERTLNEGIHWHWAELERRPIQDLLQPEFAAEDGVQAAEHADVHITKGKGKKQSAAGAAHKEASASGSAQVAPETVSPEEPLFESEDGNEGLEPGMGEAEERIPASAAAPAGAASSSAASPQLVVEKAMPHASVATPLYVVAPAPQYAAAPSRPVLLPLLHPRGEGAAAGAEEGALLGMGARARVGVVNYEPRDVYQLVPVQIGGPGMMQGRPRWDASTLIREHAVAGPPAEEAADSAAGEPAAEGEEGAESSAGEAVGELPGGEGGEAGEAVGGEIAPPAAEEAGSVESGRESGGPAGYAVQEGSTLGQALAEVAKATEGQEAGSGGVEYVVEPAEGAAATAQS